ncbi:thiolase family protein [Fusibacter paucivorans]|uniref:acetyl-CoA C-acyltransferase n=1 Tax=Fusibacter paucivorans TaxID=76009 RepID=A0ABS5PJC4_9FIRM|nr:thiolase family protein [Fusibacter paucivorans]MBS7525220.1 thiolase family protein [Fusibacter paucivorans]
MKINNQRDAVIVAYGRSPMARAFKGSFSKMHPLAFGAQTLKGVLDKLDQFDPSCVDDVIVGCAMPEKYLGYNVARLLAQRAGLPDRVPGQTVNRFCSSGLQSIATAANAIKAGECDVIIAGGIELMTGIEMTHPEIYQEAALTAMVPDAYMAMGLTAENVAAQYHVSREAMDRMAAESHQKAARAQQSGKFKREIIPILVETDNGEVTVREDEGIRPDTTADSLAQLKPCFKKDGIVTAATSSQMTDGASFVVIMAREKAERLGYEPIAKFTAFTVEGVPAGIMGIGPIKAVPKVMAKSGLTIEDMDAIELNEAFASQAIACIETLGLPIERVNVNGGAMALGHPLGATGTVLTCKLLSILEANQGRYGLVTMCIGGGMGAAGIFEMEAKH